MANANVASGHQVCSPKGHEDLPPAPYGVANPKLPEPFDPKILKSLTSIVNLRPDIEIFLQDRQICLLRPVLAQCEGLMEHR